MISKRVAKVIEIKSQSDLIQDIRVDINGRIEKAYNYVQLTGIAQVGDEVVVNTTAVELSLGTGGFHFICLEGMPVAVGALHSIVPVFAATFKKLCPDKKLVYIMSDGAALPMAFSKNVDNLKNMGLIDNTITYGNAFGGDYECINIYTSLITAKEICKADCVLVAMGPGIAGTGTKYGFSGIDQAVIIDAVEKLNGKSYIIPRISFADKRPRHKGISHHTLTILSELTNKSTNVVLNSLYEPAKLSIIRDQLLLNSIDEKHKVDFEEYDMTKEDLDKYGLKVKSMGRSFEEDKEFFEAAATVAYKISKLF